MLKREEEELRNCEVDVKPLISYLECFHAFSCVLHRVINIYVLVRKLLCVSVPLRGRVRKKSAWKRRERSSEHTVLETSVVGK